MRSGVFFAAMMPARRAAASTSPFSDSPRRTMRAVAGAIDTKPRATAMRSVRSFSPTSIIFMRRSEPARGLLHRLSIPLLGGVLAQESLRIDGRHTARAGGRDRLAIGRVGHVAGREDALHAGGG